MRRSGKCPRCGAVLRDFGLNLSPGLVTCGICKESFDPAESFSDDQILALSRLLGDESESFLRAAGFVQKPARRTDRNFIIFLVFVVFTGCFLYSYVMRFELKPTLASGVVLIAVTSSLLYLKRQQKDTEWVRD